MVGLRRAHGGRRVALCRASVVVLVRQPRGVSVGQAAACCLSRRATATLCPYLSPSLSLSLCLHLSLATFPFSFRRSRRAALIHIIRMSSNRS